MPQYIRRFATPIVLSLTLAACGDRRDDASLAQDSALNRDLQLATGDTTAQPQLTDVGPTPPPAATTPEPATSAPAPVTRRPTTSGASAGTVARTPRTTTTRPATRPATTPAPAEPATRTTASGNTVASGTAGSEARRVGMIPAGTTIALNSNERVCTNTSRVGEKFTATVADDIVGEDGAVIPSGATATVQVTSLKRSENANDPIDVGLRVTAITFGGKTYAIDATTEGAKVERVRNQPRDKDVQKVVGGAVIGAIAGQVLGKNTKSTVIGAATGAAAGTAAAAATANFEGCVPQGGRITIRLTGAEQVQVRS